MADEVNHPYIPRDLKLPGFVPGYLSQSTILAVYGISSVLVVSFMWILSGKCSFKLFQTFRCCYSFVLVNGYMIS